MQTAFFDIDTDRYERCINASKRIRWDIDDDVIRGREFDLSDKFLPDGLSLVNEIPFLTDDERRYLSQVQGRTYANIFGLVERFINAKILEISRDHWLGDQAALSGAVELEKERVVHGQNAQETALRHAVEIAGPGFVGVCDDLVRAVGRVLDGDGR